MLKIKSISKHFGGVKALNELNLEVWEGEIFGVIGPNGSGKSTLINVICGIFLPTKGDVIFEGQILSEKPTHQRLKKGIARTFQNIRLFPNLTVWQNLWVARNSEEDIKTESSFYRWFGKSSIVKKEIEKMLEFSNLENRADELASSLAFGEQRRLELARAVATKPRLLLLDEPAAGMTVSERAVTIKLLKELSKTRSVVVVEHDMEFIRQLECRITVLHEGAVLAEGQIDFVTRNQDVIDVYLGR